MGRYMHAWLSLALMGLLLAAGSPARSQTITIDGSDWHIPVNPITEAGSDYSGTVTNPNNLILSGNIPRSFLVLLGSRAVDITVRFTPNPSWHESLSLYGKRTGGSATIGGLLCVLCSVSITGGGTYIQIPQTADVPLLSITFSGTLGLDTYITYSDIFVQLELRGLSVVTPVDDYGANVVFTIASP